MHGGGARRRCRCGRGDSPGADVAGVSPVPVQMWEGEPSPGADVAWGEPMRTGRAEQAVLGGVALEQPLVPAGGAQLGAEWVIDAG
jgi:hypothetical protein